MLLVLFPTGQPQGGFDFTSPINSTLTARVDGNTARLSPNHGCSIDNLTWERDQTLWLRWTELNDLGTDHGLAIDDLQFSASSVPEPSEYAAVAGVALVGFAVWRRRFGIKA
ncbi:MAG: PEP-CTERM sorting domain-containing protein [Pedosphaera sp.]|nr:PEP-CTERM sorting domain-containing protein [Pedosphaera sp.]